MAIPAPLSKTLKTLFAGAMAATLLAGCSGVGGADPTGGSSQPSKGGKGSTGAEQTPSEPPAAFAEIKQDLVPAQKATLKTNGLTVTNLLVTREMPGLAYGLDIARGRILRQHDWAGGGELSITPRLVGSSSKAVAVALATGGKLGDNTAMVYYDPQSNQTFSSAALIAPAKWAELGAKVGELAGDKSAQATEQLGKPGYPMGTGPALGFNSEGDLVVQFQTVDGARIDSVRVPADQATAWLSEFGVRAKAAAQYPTKATTPSKFAKPAATLIGSGTGRPSTVIGVDCTKVKCAALTFDDGPVPETADLLATLKKNKAPATFFALGTSVDNYPKLLTQTAAAGMEIASHHQVHNQMNVMSAERLSKQVTMSRTNIRRLTGQDPLFLRPPYGAHNSASDAIVGKNGMAVALWSVDTLDWKHSQSSQSAAQSSILSIVGQQLGNGGVILMHDIHANSRASAAAVIKKVRDEGYTLVSLAELAPSKYRYGKSFCTSPAIQESCGI